jgi:hypothetical protein
LENFTKYLNVNKCKHEPSWQILGKLCYI